MRSEKKVLSPRRLLFVAQSQSLIHTTTCFKALIFVCCIINPPPVKRKHLFYLVLTSLQPRLKANEIVVDGTEDPRRRELQVCLFLQRVGIDHLVALFVFSLRAHLLSAGPSSHSFGPFVIGPFVIGPFIGVHSSTYLVHSSIRQSIRRSIHWSVGPFIGPLVRSFIGPLTTLLSRRNSSVSKARLTTKV